MVSQGSPLKAPAEHSVAVSPCLHGPVSAFGSVVVVVVVEYVTSGVVNVWVTCEVVVVNVVVVDVLVVVVVVVVTP